MISRLGQRTSSSICARKRSIRLTTAFASSRRSGTDGTFMKWVIVGLNGILAGFVMVGESIAKIAAWMRGG
ncbi:MAG: hypothetical protein K0Q64_2262 [Nitrobacter vulgaris]|nr:hypothetical protein [Nitrobacter vulgaris]